jgi:hypothetical protein
MGLEWLDQAERKNWRKAPIVCADVIALAYQNGGLDLNTFTDWTGINLSESKWPTDPTRSVPALRTLLDDHHQKYQWGDGHIPEVGDMVLRENLRHSGLIVEVNGSDASQINVIQASYPNNIINKVSLAEWQENKGSSYFGHPNPDVR